MPPIIVRGGGVVPARRSEMRKVRGSIPCPVILLWQVGITHSRYVSWIPWAYTPSGETHPWGLPAVGGTHPEQIWGGGLFPPPLFQAPGVGLGGSSYSGRMEGHRGHIPASCVIGLPCPRLLPPVPLFLCFREDC